MRQLISIIAILSALTAGLINISNDKDGPKMIEKYFIGTMPGGYSFEMFLTFKGETLTGSVFNTYSNITFVSGTLDPNKNFILKEFEDEKVTGIYKGKIFSNGEIKGVWSSPDGIRKAPFKMIQEVKTAAS